MNLRAQAKSDLSFTLQDGENGFGMPVIIEQGIHTIGNNVSSPFYAQVGRVSFLIDPDTGQGVNGDFAHIVVNLEDMKNAGFEVDTRNIKNGDFRISAPDSDGTIQSYSNKSFEPDNTLGVIRMICSTFDRDNTVNEAILREILHEIEVIV
jgi:hypothetical protein